MGLVASLLKKYDVIPIFGIVPITSSTLLINNTFLSSYQVCVCVCEQFMRSAAVFKPYTCAVREREERERGREREREGGREIGREKDGERGREKGRETEREIGQAIQER